MSCTNKDHSSNSFEGGTYRFELGSCDDVLFEPDEEFITKKGNQVFIKTLGKCAQENHVFSSNSSVVFGVDSIYLNIAVEQNYTGSDGVVSLSKCVCNNSHIFSFDKEIDIDLPIAVSFAQ